MFDNVLITLIKHGWLLSWVRILEFTHLQVQQKSAQMLN